MRLFSRTLAPLAGILIAFTLLPAFAADLGGKMSGMLAEVVDTSPARKVFTGVYIGIHGGMDLSSTEVGLGGLGIDGLSGNGEAYGIHGGFDLHVRGTPIVIGIMADWTESNARFAVSPGLLSADLEESWAVVGRIGYAHGHVLPYVLAGYTEADVSAKILGTSIGGTKLEGWVFGGGVEFALNGGLSLALEYRFTDFDKLNFGGPGGLDLETERHQVMAAVRYKFGNFMEGK